MRKSIIFLKSSAGIYRYQNYDCCESLGKGFNDSSSNMMYVAIPKKELLEFFTVDNYNNLHAYLDFITECFEINYSIITEDIPKFKDFSDCGYQQEDCIIVSISRDKYKVYSNKHFNVAYNVFRYLWYHHYTNIAIIATNLYKLSLFSDPLDVLAVAQSYQTTTDRAVLPFRTDDLSGILFFRPKEHMFKELNDGIMFNTIFYKYPVHFNPEVKIRGSFFSDYETTIESKSLFGKLQGIDNIEDLPHIFINNMKLCVTEYLKMKERYILMRMSLDKLGYTMKDTLELSEDLNSVSLRCVDKLGNSKLFAYSFETVKEKV